MRTSHRSANRAVRLTCETLEDRLTPVLAFSLSGPTSLLAFDTASPAITTTTTITGVTAGETLVGIDIRPATGQLYALGENAAGTAGTIYTLTTTGTTTTATVVGTAGSVTPTITGTQTAAPPATGGYGFDFNPTVDRIRVVTTGQLSFVVNPDTGVVQTNAPALNGGTTTADGSAYTNNAAGATVTTLYAISAATDQLYIQVPASSLLTAQGAVLGVDIGVVNGFDIPAGVSVTTANTAATGVGFLAATVGTTTNLYSVDLTTGAATLVGAIGTGTVPVSGLAVTTGGTVSFQSATQTVGEAAGSVNVVLTRTGGTGVQTVTVNVTSGTATPGADFAPGPYTVTFGNGAATATLNIPIANDALVEGTETFTLSITTVTNGLIGAQKTTTISITDDDSPLNLVLGTGAGLPIVTAFNADGTQHGPVLTPYGANATGGVRVAHADINGDGKADIIVGAATGLAIVQAFSGADLSPLGSFSPFGNFTGGVNVAAGDLNGDGRADVIAGTARNGSLVMAYSGADLSSLGSFTTAPGSTLGVTVAAADINGDGKLDIITGNATGTAVVRAFSGVNLSSLGSFSVFGATPVGVNVSGTDVNGDGIPDLLLGTASGVSKVEAYDGTNLAFLGSVQPFGALIGGVFVG